MPPHPQVAAELTGAPFRGSAAVRAGLVSWSRLRSGCWRRLLPDVYAAASLPETVTLRARAAALVLPSGAAVTGSSAAWLHGVDVRTGDEPLEVTLPRGAAHAPHPSLRIRRALLTAADVTLAQAVPVTTPLRTAFDFARQPDEVAGMVGLDALLHAELVTAGQVLDFAAAHPGWRGVRRVPHRLALSEPATESPMESKLRLILINGGLPWPQAQLVVRDSTGRLVGRLDLGYRRRGWASSTTAADIVTRSPGTTTCAGRTGCGPLAGRYCATPVPRSTAGPTSSASKLAPYSRRRCKRLEISAMLSSRVYHRTGYARVLKIGVRRGGSGDVRRGDVGRSGAGGDQALRTAAADCSPRVPIDDSRILNFWILPVTVIGNSSTNCT